MGLRILGLAACLFLIPVQAARAGSEFDAACLKCHGKADAKSAAGKSVFVDPAAHAASLHGREGTACVDCHADLADAKPGAHAAKLAPADCVTCHEEMAPLHPFHPMMAKEPTGVACQSCHGGHELKAVKDPAFPFAPATQIQACGKCHELMRDDYLTSQHQSALKAGAKEAPDCVTCHSVALVTRPAGAAKNQLKLNQVKVCLACHLDEPAVRARVTPSAGFIAAYRQSVHGRALQSGNEKAPGCADCHGSHAVKKGDDSSSATSKSKIQEACAACHKQEATQFAASVHGTALARGALDAPTCTTCHGEHDIQKHDDPSSPVAAGNVSRRVCQPCHESVAINEKYALKSDRGQTFSSSFHGLAISGGSTEAANCASCHGAHNILPSSNEASSINKKNLSRTCGQCHPGANDNFASGPVHVSQARANSPLLYWISTLYLGLIVVVIGGMFGHNALDFAKKARRKYAVSRGELEEHPVPHRLYLRMSVSERQQHAFLVISFVALVFTGFLLRYPEAGWARWLNGLSPRMFALRAITHRIAAVVMVIASLYHIYYLAFTERGRQLFKDLLPRWQDATDAVGVMKYNLGLRKDKPLLDRFCYVEKAEYWALVWGTMVMAATGAIMWFENTFIGLFSRPGYDVARTIHFYEACLATLAIIVWHFYFVLFNPDTYPGSLSWLNGMVTEREMLEEHPLELARIKAEEAALEKAALEKAALEKAALEKTALEKTAAAAALEAAAKAAAKK